MSAHSRPYDRLRLIVEPGRVMATCLMPGSNYIVPMLTLERIEYRPCVENNHPNEVSTATAATTTNKTREFRASRTAGAEVRGRLLTVPSRCRSCRIYSTTMTWVLLGRCRTGMAPCSALPFSSRPTSHGHRFALSHRWRSRSSMTAPELSGGVCASGRGVILQDLSSLWRLAA
jgi:hypothetical protein